jgi:hypothetical protein
LKASSRAMLTMSGMVWDESPRVLLQRCWRLRTSVSFLKASLGAPAAMLLLLPLPGLELLLAALSLIVFLAILRFGLSSS